MGSQVKNIIEPPLLQIASPEDGLITEKNTLLVQGKTGKEVAVCINGQEIANNNDGEFKESINLSPGINTIVISATKKHGKTTSITRYVILKNNAEFGLAR